jgi:hypothetical protein
MKSDGECSTEETARRRDDAIRRALIANYGSRANLEKKLGHKVDYSWEKE